MKFNEIEYKRPNYDEYVGKMNSCIDQMEKADSVEKFMDSFNQLNQYRTHVKTMRILTAIRYTINTKDEFYEAENNYWDETSPKYDAIDTRMFKVTLHSSLKEELKKHIPETFFLLGECKLKAFDESIMEEMVEENKLMSEYGKLKASAKIPFEGKIYNLAEIAAIAEDTNRDRRKAASEAKMAFFEEHEADFDRIYDDMVKVRTKMAKKLGYKNYVELAYYCMDRLDYDFNMVGNYRKQILDYCTPLSNEIYEKQKRRLGLEKLEYYDLDLHFKNGNATPFGNKDELVSSAVQMYHEMSEETGKFIDLMNDNDLWDLESKPNKEMGGYEEEIPEYRVPFIFSNFNGTSGDVDVLTHEAGHAFQTYMAQDISILDLTCPTMESAEIDSMSMEFFAYPWMHLFFKENADKYKYSHLSGTITFLPYGVLVDHFQEEVYSNPEWSKEERKACWRKLEKMYTPWKNYEECELLEKGCWWYQQNHIFQCPFYYIDYTLAQVCAQQFFIRMDKKDDTYWNDYLHLLQLGGTLSFTNLLKEAHLKVPFEDGCIEEIMEYLKDKIDSIDDNELN